jgi:hypothetical protein
MTPKKTIRLQWLERVSQWPTRDAILSAVDPNDPPHQSAIAGTADPGLIWTGLEDALNSLPAKVRDAVGKMFMGYAEGQGWKVDASKTAHATGDGGRRLTNWEQRASDSVNMIREINEANRAHWSRPAPRGTATTDGAVVNDRRQVGQDGAALAGATRDLVSSINDVNRKYWADVEAARPRG